MTDYLLNFFNYLSNNYYNQHASFLIAVKNICFHDVIFYSHNEVINAFTYLINMKVLQRFFSFISKEH